MMMNRPGCATVPVHVISYNSNPVRLKSLEIGSVTAWPITAHLAIPPRILYQSILAASHKYSIM